MSNKKKIELSEYVTILVHREKADFFKITGMVQRGEVDIAGSDFTVTAIRSEAVDFLVPLVEINLKLFIINPLGSNNWWAYIRPLTKEVHVYSF